MHKKVVMIKKKSGEPVSQKNVGEKEGKILLGVTRMDRTKKVYLEVSWCKRRG